MDVTNKVPDLNDADILKIEKVVEAINAKQGSTVQLEAFRQEVIDRFERIGFRVVVNPYTTNQAGLFAFDIEITERLDGAFDPDQMVYEATHDVLGLGEKGFIKSPKG